MSERELKNIYSALVLIYFGISLLIKVIIFMGFAIIIFIADITFGYIILPIVSIFALWLIFKNINKQIEVARSIVKRNTKFKNERN